MKRARRLLVPSILACALLALALAATASAEVRVGEASGPVDPAVKPEADVIGARAEYDSATGILTFKLTTVAAPWPGTEAEPSELMMVAGLGNPLVCNASALGTSAYPTFGVQYRYAESGHALWVIEESAGDTPEVPETLGEAAVSTSAGTTTFVATAPRAVNKPYSCAIASVRAGVGAPEAEPLIFPIAVPPPPPPTAVTTPAPAPTRAPASAPLHPAPAALSIARSKALKLKLGKWKTVRIKVANTGGSATVRGSLRLKAPRGVLVKPEKQKLPVLGAGESWTITAKVQVTAKAKKKSKVAVTATAGGVTAKGSLVFKR